MPGNVPALGLWVRSRPLTAGSTSTAHRLPPLMPPAGRRLCPGVPPAPIPMATILRRCEHCQTPRPVHEFPGGGFSPRGRSHGTPLHGSTTGGGVLPSPICDAQKSTTQTFDKFPGVCNRKKISCPQAAIWPKGTGRTAGRPLGAAAGTAPRTWARRAGPRAPTSSPPRGTSWSCRACPPPHPGTARHRWRGG